MGQVSSPSTAVAHVEVHTGPDGALLVRWTLDGDPAAVEVASGPGPQRVDHRHHATVPADDREITLPGPAGARTFVSVAPAGGGSAVVAADRRVGFEGVTNFRDLGGYRTASGGRIRWGRAFRADALHGLSPADLATFHTLGLNRVYDLREEVERSDRPDPVPALWHPITGRPAGADPLTSVPSGLTSEDGERFLTELYLGIIDHAAVRIGAIYAGLAGEGGLPAVFHCHAGKDRAGMVASLLLEALGVDRQTVLDDYELTSRYRPRGRQDATFDLLLQAGMSPEAAGAVLTTPRSAMAAALGHLDDRYGGIEGYLLHAAGIEPGVLARLRDLLIEPPGSEGAPSRI